MRKREERRNARRAEREKAKAQEQEEDVRDKTPETMALARCLSRYHIRVSDFYRAP
jgi:hypothetical protein